MIRLLGLGWEEAFHPWTKEEYVYNSSELFEHLINKVIPLARKLKKPVEAPTSFPKLPEIQKLGTVSNLAKQAEDESKEDYEKMKIRVLDELKRKEEAGERDRLEEFQCNVPPEWQKLNKFEVEMAFEYNGEDGQQNLGWYHGTVVELMNEKYHTAKIEWDKDCIGTRDAKVSTHKLVPSNWNPQKAKKGGWRRYLKL